MFGKSKVVANASNFFFMVTFSLKVNLRSNVKEASLSESRIYRSISQFSIRGGFICCVKSLDVEQSKGYYWIIIDTAYLPQVMMTVLHSWGFVYLNSSYAFVEEDEDHDDPG